jgi:transposase-like protein
MRCPHCQSEIIVKNGTRRLHDNQRVQYYRCRNRFDDLFPSVPNPRTDPSPNL